MRLHNGVEYLFVYLYFLGQCRARFERAGRHVGIKSMPLGLCKGLEWQSEKMAKHNVFFLIVGVLWLIVQPVSAAAFQGVASTRRVDTAIINGFYKDAFSSVEENLRKSDDLINKAWKMSIDIGYDRGIADGYYYTGTVYMRKDVWDVAGRYFEKAVSLYTQGNFLGNLADCYLRLGQIYVHDGRYYTGFQHFLDGLRVATDTGRDIDRIRLSITLARYHNTVS